MNPTLRFALAGVNELVGDRYDRRDEALRVLRILLFKPGFLLECRRVP